jgi:hypothetical protein
VFHPTQLVRLTSPALLLMPRERGGGGGGAGDGCGEAPGDGQSHLHGTALARDGLVSLADWCGVVWCGAVSQLGPVQLEAMEEALEGVAEELRASGREPTAETMQAEDVTMMVSERTDKALKDRLAKEGLSMTEFQRCVRVAGRTATSRCERQQRVCMCRPCSVSSSSTRGMRGSRRR